MKILKTLYTATLCAAMAVSTSSCLNSWLDQSPADGIDAETAIKNSDDLANVRTGLYAAVKGNSSLINYYGRLMFVYGDMRGEDIQYEYNGGSGRANFYYYMEYTTADNFTLYGRSRQLTRCAHRYLPAGIDRKAKPQHGSPML